MSFALFGSDVDQKARPDISTAGSSEAQSWFFILGKSSAPGKVTDYAFDLHEARTSPVWVGQAHMCFRVDSGLDANEVFVGSPGRRRGGRTRSEVGFGRAIASCSSVVR